MRVISTNIHVNTTTACYKNTGARAHTLSLSLFKLIQKENLWIQCLAQQQADMEQDEQNYFILTIFITQ
jgi:hypothetical protein